MDNALTFANPAFLALLLALVPLVLLRLRSQRIRAAAVSALVAPRLRARLLVGQRPAAHWGRFTLQLLALALLVVAIAGPRYGHDEELTVAEGRNVLIGIDTSRSMLAPDLKPDRLTRAKLAAHDLIRSLPGDRFGIIAFAGSSFLQAPLTVDHEAVIESITQLDTEIIPRGGTNLGRALELARETFKKAGSESNALVLFSDGEDLETKDAPSFNKDSLESPPMIVITVGTGTRGGAILPDPDSRKPGEFIRDDDGEIVRSRLDATRLVALAEETGGLYLQLDSTAAMRQVVAGALDRLEKSAMEGRMIYKPIDRYRWALLPGILLLIISLLPLPAHASLRTPSTPSASRIPTTTGVAVLFFILHPSSFILSATANPSTAWQKYQSGNFESAAATYEDSLQRKNLHPKEHLHYGAASAAYRLGDFEKAIRSYGEALLSKQPAMQERAHYSLGNALYREGESRLQGEGPAEADPEAALGQWRDAVDHYEAALHLNPENSDALFNRDLVKKRIEELEQQQEQQQQQQQQQKGEQDQEQNEDQQKNENQDQQQQDQEKSQQPQENQEGEQQQKDQQPQGDQGDDPKDQQNEGKGDEESEPMEEPETPEGELQSEENPQEGQPREPREAEQPHPETGFTRSQARQILRSLADEDLDVRPLVPPSREAVFKNW